MKNQKIGKRRSDRPSGRQASEQPEHSSTTVAPESLHQGQGPDFISQDKRMQDENEGVSQLKKKSAKPQEGSHQQAVNPETENKGRFDGAMKHKK